MADGIVQVAPDSTGKIIDTSELTVGANTVERQRIVIASPTNASALVEVGNPGSDGDSGDYSIASEAYLKAYNGSTWDRLRSSIAYGLEVDVKRLPTPVAITLGNSTGKTNIGKTGSLVSTATTADQVILTYTVTTGKTLYLLGWDVAVRLTTIGTTATTFGTASLENPSGTKLNTRILAGPGVVSPPSQITLPEPWAISSATVIRIVCTPAAATSYTWQGNLWGYEV